jgi:hypothetical protein
VPVLFIQDFRAASRLADEIGDRKEACAVLMSGGIRFENADRSCDVDGRRRPGGSAAERKLLILRLTPRLFRRCLRGGRALAGYHGAPLYAARACPEGETAPKIGSLRRTARIACRNDSLSGSSSAYNAASCMRPRTAKCSMIKPWSSCRTNGGVLLRKTIFGPAEKYDGRRMGFIEFTISVRLPHTPQRTFLKASHGPPTVDPFGDQSSRL